MSEAARVLRSGGGLFGYDLVDSWPAETLHRLDGSPHRLATADGIRRRLAELGLDDVRTDDALRGLVTRFSATRSIETRLSGATVSTRSEQP